MAGDVEGLDAGLYHYSAINHSLTKLKGGDLRSDLAQAALGQYMIKIAPITILLGAYYKKTAETYGKRGIRYVHMEIGHTGQNLHLQAEALNLGTVMIGAFHDPAVKDILGLKVSPLYLVPVGKV